MLERNKLRRKVTMTMKDLYEQVKHKDNAAIVGQYLGIFVYWILSITFCIAIVWLGWNYIANLFNLRQLTYTQIAIITTWLTCLKYMFFSTRKTNNEKFR